MDLPESTSSKEHGGCTFDGLLSQHRTEFLSRVDSLRCSVEKFDERYRQHVLSCSRGLLRGPRGADTGDAAADAWRWCAGRTADGVAGPDRWPTTSESDTDESVIEVCTASRKLRQARGTQTSTARCPCQRNTMNPRPSCFLDAVSVSDAATQTEDCGRPPVADQLWEKKVASWELLGVLETLAMQRQKNGHQRFLVEKTAPGSTPIARKTQNGQASISNLLNRLPDQPGCLVDSIHRLLKVDELCARKDESDTASRSARHVKRKLLHPGDSEIECGCHGLGTRRVRDAPSASVEEDSHGTEDPRFRADDDLWRLAEEGRLPWTCDRAPAPPSGTDAATGDGRDAPVVITARLFYSCEVDSRFGPLRVFRRKKRCLPPWRWVSTPPNLGVIPEHPGRQRSPKQH